MGKIVMQYKPLVEDLKFTLDCLLLRDIREIVEHNVELGLPKDEIERLQQQIEEGSKLEAREMKAILLLNRKIHKRQLKLATRQSKLLKRERDILRALQEAKGVQKLSGSNTQTVAQERIGGSGLKQASKLLKRERDMLRARQEAKGVQGLSGSNTQTVVQEQIGGSGLKQAAPINGGGAALEAVFEVLFSAVIQTKEKTRVFKRILGHLESTLYNIKPLIEEIAEYNQLLHLTEEELETFRVEMEKGVELVHKCSKISLRENNKKYEYTNKLFGLNDPLQRLINRQKVQLARENAWFRAHSNIQLESDMIQYDQTESWRPVLELPSATVRLDVLSVQGAGKMTKSRKLEEGAIKVEGSGVVQNQTEIQASNMEESKIEFEPQQGFSSEFGT
ncbi:hypothetical protein ACFX13_015235 [Malus domestica]